MTDRDDDSGLGDIRDKAEYLDEEGLADGEGGDSTKSSSMDERARKAGATHRSTGTGPGTSASGGSVGGVRVPGTDRVTGSQAERPADDEHR